jgi:osmotically-inducible protein OsmY
MAPADSQATLRWPLIASAELASRIRGTYQLRGFHCLSRLSVAVEDGLVVLSGQVPTFYLKQIAQELARHVDGVREVANRISVCPNRP